MRCFIFPLISIYNTGAGNTNLKGVKDPFLSSQPNLTPSHDLLVTRHPIQPQTNFIVTPDISHKEASPPTTPPTSYPNTLNHGITSFFSGPYYLIPLYSSRLQNIFFSLKYDQGETSKIGSL